MINRLKEIRLTLGYNQQYMADKLECNLRTYRSYEYEDRNTPDEIARLLNSELNVNLNWYFTGVGPMFINSVKKTDDICEDPTIIKKFRLFYKRYTKLLAEYNLTDYEVSRLTGINETRLEKIGLGIADITMEEFIKLRSQLPFDSNQLLFDEKFENSTEPEAGLSAEELAVLKKLAQKIK